MAQRRMFSKRITESGKFYLLSQEAQLFYFHMGMIADDDGVADCFFITRVLRVGEDVVRELEENGFIKVVPNHDSLFYIVDWHENNQVRKDRYTPSIYADLIDSIGW